MTFVEHTFIGSPEGTVFRLRGLVLGKCDGDDCTSCNEDEWGFAIAHESDDLWAFIGDAPSYVEAVARTIADAVTKDVEWFARVPYVMGVEWALIEEFPRRAYIVQTQPLGAERVAQARRMSVPELRESHYAARRLASAPGRGQYMPGGGSVN